MGPIPWDRIAEYADRLGLERDVAAGFVLVIRTMDSCLYGLGEEGSGAAAGHLEVSRRLAR